MNNRHQINASDDAHAFIESIRKAAKLRYGKPVLDYIIKKIRKDKAFVARMKADLK